MKTIKIDDVEYDLADASPAVIEQVNNIEFVSEQILQRTNELQIADTAKIGYLNALKRELSKLKNNG